MIIRHRNPISQSKHDRKVAQEARAYQARGYFVEADIPGYFSPDVIYGYKPDVKAEKVGYICIEEVETPDTIHSAHSLVQDRAFRKARRYLGWHYRRVIAR
jgi:hypothetical protein